MPTVVRARKILVPLAALAVLAYATTTLRGHDVITSTVNYNRDLRPILQARCVSCHREGGRAFSLESYAGVRPWAKAIEEEVLQRRMPPWGAVPGFGRFVNDPSLTMTEMQQFAEWAEGGAPEGEPLDASQLTVDSAVEEHLASLEPVREVAGAATLDRALTLAGLQITSAPEKSAFRLGAVLPGGAQVPLLWIHSYSRTMSQLYRLHTPLELPAGTVIRGLPAGVSLQLFAPQGAGASARQ